MSQQDTKRAPIAAERPSEKPVLLRAINATLRALEDRGRFYRNLILAVVLVSTSSVLLAVIFLRWIPLLGLILLVPLAGGFVVLDSRRVRQWRREILQMCRAESLDCSLLRQTLSGFGHLPRDSIEGMLSTLQTGERNYNASHPWQTARGDEFEALSQRQERRILIATIILMFALTAVAGAASYQSGTLIFCGVGLLIVFGLFKAR